MSSFQPSFGLGNPHIQTIVSSVARKPMQRVREQTFIQSATTEILEVEGIRLQVRLNVAISRPLVILIAGWLGHDRSTYVVAAAKALDEAGFNVARLNLRDHGDTAALNEGMFNSSRIDEVAGAVAQLADKYGSGHAGLVGFSLGGNFALRVARCHEQIKTLAVCPAIDPAATLDTIDKNVIYQRYFINKWRNTWQQKQTAFPQKFDFEYAAKLSTVAALNDYFVRYHSEFENSAAYFATYDLRGAGLEGVHAHILAAKDDPIIDFRQYENLPESISIDLTERGGHGAYIENWQLESWVDHYIVNHFKQEL